MQRPALIALLACAVCAHAASYTTYIGDANQYQVSAIAADATGNTYVAGSRVIVPASISPHSGALTDVFVSKLDPSGNVTLLATFSGKGTDQANGIAVDPSGNIYIVGQTTSTDFPLHHPLQSAPYPGAYVPLPVGVSFLAGTGFLMKLSADGTVLYSTYFGGTESSSSLNGVAADSDGNAYVTGTTKASDYPHTPGLPAGTVSGATYYGDSGALFAKVDATGSQILYAGVLTGDAPECTLGDLGCPLYPGTSGAAIAVDPAGNAYIAGNAGGGDLPTTPGALLTDGIGAFVAKVNSAGTGMVYVTYLGPGISGLGSTSAADFVYAIAADGAGNAYISGTTLDPAFPATAGAFQTTLSPLSSFVAKLNPSGNAMVWATFLGGPGGYQVCQAQTVATDSAGNVWVSGSTLSSGFPTTVSVIPGGGEFLAELNSTGSALVYSALFPSGMVAAALAVAMRRPASAATVASPPCLTTRSIRETVAHRHPRVCNTGHVAIVRCMAAERVVIVAPDAPAAIGPYSHAVACGELLFCSGQIPLDPASGELISVSVAAQTQRCLDNLAAVCDAAGSSLSRALRLTVDPPARVSVGVAALPRGALVEIDAIVAL